MENNEDRKDTRPAGMQDGAAQTSRRAAQNAAAPTAADAAIIRETAPQRNARRG